MLPRRGDQRAQQQFRSGGGYERPFAGAPAEVNPFSLPPRVENQLDLGNPLVDQPQVREAERIQPQESPQSLLPNGVEEDLVSILQALNTSQHAPQSPQTPPKPLLSAEQITLLQTILKNNPELTIKGNSILY